jgi:hypothetical protein
VEALLREDDFIQEVQSLSPALLSLCVRPRTAASARGARRRRSRVGSWGEARQCWGLRSVAVPRLSRFSPARPPCPRPPPCSLTAPAQLDRLLYYLVVPQDLDGDQDKAYRCVVVGGGGGAEPSAWL